MMQGLKIDEMMIDKRILTYCSLNGSNGWVLNTLLWKPAVGSLIEDVVWMSYLQKGHKTLWLSMHIHTGIYLILLSIG